MNAIAELKLDGTNVRASLADLIDYAPAPKESRLEPTLAERMDAPKKVRDASLLLADKRLAIWADWAKQNRQVLGYPTISSLFRVMMDSKRLKLKDLAELAAGRIITAQGKQALSFREEATFVPDAIAEVDRVVARLPRPLERVITANYFTYGPIEARAKAAGHKRARFSQLLEAAKYAVWVGLEAATSGE
jgi:hypothetical protein